MKLSDKRWGSEIVYMTAEGLSVKIYEFDEISELDDFIEGFVDFRMIVSIQIVPGSINIED